MNIFAQAELLKNLQQPPTGDTNPLIWLMWALVLLLAASLSAILWLHFHSTKVFVPNLLKDFWAAIAKKDDNTTALITQIEERCEARAKHKSDVRREDNKARDDKFLRDQAEARRELRECQERFQEMVVSNDGALRAIGRRRLKGPKEKGQDDAPSERS